MNRWWKERNVNKNSESKVLLSSLEEKLLWWGDFQEIRRQLPTDIWLHILNSKAPAVFKHGISIWPNADHTTDNPIKKVFGVGRGRRDQECRWKSLSACRKTWLNKYSRKLWEAQPPVMFGNHQMHRVNKQKKHTNGVVSLICQWWESEELAVKKQWVYVFRMEIQFSSWLCPFNSNKSHWNWMSRWRL